MHESTLTAGQVAASFAAKDLAASFKVLASPLNLRIIRELHTQPRYVSELACALNTPQSMVSRGLAQLQRAGFVHRLPRRSHDTSWRCHLYALESTASEKLADLGQAATTLIA